MVRARPMEDYTLHATAEHLTAARTFTLQAFGFHRESVRRATRMLVALGLLALFGYCLATAWQVLEQLSHVKLSDVTRALAVVSVRDAVLCCVGYRIGTELLRAITRGRSE